MKSSEHERRRKASPETLSLTDRIRTLADAAARRGTNRAPCLRVANPTKAHFELYKYYMR